MRARWWFAALTVGVAAGALWPATGVEVRQGGRCLLFLPLAEEETLDVTWRHSVDGIPVRDVFTRRGRTLLLTATFNPYFAAGLGEVPGRGRVVATPRHGLAIVEIDESIGRLPLRVGGADVAHALLHRGRVYDLSAGHAGRLVELSLSRRPRAWVSWVCRPGLPSNG